MKSALTRAIERKEKGTRDVLNGRAACGTNPSRNDHRRGSLLHRIEEAMSYLDTPQHKVGSAAYQLRQIIDELWQMRLKSETADLVIDEQFSLKAALNSLSALCEDVRVAKDNMKVAAE